MGPLKLPANKRGEKPDNSKPNPPEQPPPEISDREPQKHRGARIVAAGLLGLSGLAGVAGASVYATAHLPVCADSQQVVGWSQGRPCVSLSTAVQGATAWRYASAPFHLRDTLKSWDSAHHQIFPAPPSGRQGQESSNQLKLVSWNLHHGLSQDSTGARPQRELMIEQLQQEDADVILLQEVAPGDAGKLAESLEMTGYYAASTPVQGNMILLRPDITVEHESILMTTGTPSLKDWIMQGGGSAEPRNLQILDAQLPGGQTLRIWNTHHLTGDYSAAQHQRAWETVSEALATGLNPDQAVVGGGDLNTSDPNHPLIQGIQDLPGASAGQFNIDWLMSTQKEPLSVEGERVMENGIMVSDHPLVRANLDLS